jgi:hypothetical protein
LDDTAVLGLVEGFGVGEVLRAGAVNGALVTTPLRIGAPVTVPPCTGDDDRITEGAEVSVVVATGDKLTTPPLIGAAVTVLCRYSSMSRRRAYGRYCTRPLLSLQKRRALLTIIDYL